MPPLILSLFRIDNQQSCLLRVFYYASANPIAKFMGPTRGPPGSCRPQMGPMLAPWTLLSGYCKLLAFGDLCFSVTAACYERISFGNKCHYFIITKPLPELLLTHRQFGSWIKLQWIIYQNTTICIQENGQGHVCPLRNSGNSVSVPIYKCRNPGW